MAGRPGRPATGQVPNHSIRMGEALWDEAHAAAKANGEKFSTFVERALRAELARQARRLQRQSSTREQDLIEN